MKLIRPLPLILGAITGLLIFVSIVTAETANAQAVVLSNQPNSGTTELTEPFNTTKTTGNHARFIEPLNNDLGTVTRVYVMGCGVPSAGGSWSIYDSSQNTYTWSTTTATIVNCTPTFFDDKKNTFLQWSYFDINHSFDVGDIFYYRINTTGNDFALEDGQQYFYNAQGAGYTSSTGNNFPDTRPNFKRTGDYLPFFVMVNGNITTPPNTPIQGISNTYETKFLSFDYSATSTGSTTSQLNFSTEFYIEQTELVPPNVPTLVSFRLAGIGGHYPDVEQNESLTPTQGTSTKSTIFDSLPNGQYVIEVRFNNIASVRDLAQRPFRDTYIIAEFILEDGVITEIQVDPIYTNTPSENRYLECSITRIDNCLINALVFVFVPTDSVTEVLKQSYQNFINRKPFTYVSTVETIITTPLATETKPPPPSLTAPLWQDTDITLIASSTYTQYIGTTTFNILYNLAIAAIYVSLIFAIWALRKKLFT